MSCSNHWWKEHGSLVRFNRILPESQKYLWASFHTWSFLFSSERIILNSSALVLCLLDFVPYIELYSIFLTVASFILYYICEIYLCCCSTCSSPGCSVMLHLPKGGGHNELIIWSYSAWESYLVSPIYLFNNFFISVWTHGYFFYTLGYNPVLLDLFCCSKFSILAIGSFFSWLLSAFDILYLSL